MDILILILYYLLISVIMFAIIVGTFLVTSGLLNINGRISLMEHFSPSNTKSSNLFPAVTLMFFLLFTSYYGYLDSSDINFIILLVLILTFITAIINFIAMNPIKFLNNLIAFVMYWWIYNYYF